MFVGVDEKHIVKEFSDNESEISKALNIVEVDDDAFGNGDPLSYRVEKKTQEDGNYSLLIELLS